MTLRDIIAGTMLSLSLASCTALHRNTAPEPRTQSEPAPDAEKQFWDSISSCANYIDKCNLAHRLFGSVDRFPPKVAESMGDQECDTIDCYPLCRRGEEKFKFYGIENIAIENALMLYRKAYGKIPREKELMVAAEILSWRFENHGITHADRVNGRKPRLEEWHKHYFPPNHFSGCLTRYGIAPLTGEEQVTVAQEAVSKIHGWTAEGAHHHLAEQGISVTLEQLKVPYARAQIREFTKWMTLLPGCTPSLEDLVSDDCARGVLHEDEIALSKLLDAYANRDDLYEAITLLIGAGIAIPRAWTRQNLACLSMDACKLLDFADAINDPFLVRHALPGCQMDSAWLEGRLMNNWRDGNYAVSLEYLKQMRKTSRDYPRDHQLRASLEDAWSDECVPAHVGLVALELLESSLLSSPAVHERLRQRAARCLLSLNARAADCGKALEDIAAISAREDSAFQTDIARELARLGGREHGLLRDALQAYVRMENRQCCGALGMFLHEQGDLHGALDAFKAAGWQLQSEYVDAETRKDYAKLQELQRR